MKRFVRLMTFAIICIVEVISRIIGVYVVNTSAIYQMSNNMDSTLWITIATWFTQNRFLLYLLMIGLLLYKDIVGEIKARKDKKDEN